MILASPEASHPEALLEAAHPAAHPEASLETSHPEAPHFEASPEPETLVITVPPEIWRDDPGFETPPEAPRDLPGSETPPALAAARAAAHQAAAIAAGEAELRRSGRSATFHLDPGTGIRPPTGPAEPRTAMGSEFVSANAAARRIGPRPTGPDTIIEGIVAGAGRSAATRRMYQRRRRAALLVFLLVTVLLLVLGQLIGNDEHRLSRVTIAPAVSALPDGLPPEARLPDVGVGAATAAELTRPATAAGQPPSDTADTVPAWPGAGTDTGFTFVGGYGPVLGSTGRVRRFKVAVEQDIGQGDGAGFAQVVERILGDRRSWIAARQFRLRRVPQPAASEFTIYLASAHSSEKMCGRGGLETDGFTSCRLPGRVIINVDRWEDAVPDYDAPLDTYRAYAINHEVGHQLGHGHEACPGKGQPAPVMMQQTYGLKGCLPYSWPYLDGKRYSGAPIA